MAFVAVKSKTSALERIHSSKNDASRMGGRGGGLGRLSDFSTLPYAGPKKSGKHNFVNCTEQPSLKKAAAYVMVCVAHTEIVLQTKLTIPRFFKH